MPDISGIKEIKSRSSENQSSVTVELLGNVKPRDVLDDIKIRVDALNTLPIAAERPIISLLEREEVTMQVAVIANNDSADQKTLRDVAESFRRGLLTQPGVSRVELANVPNYEMTIEVSPQSLQNYQLTLEQIGQAIRNGATDVSGGNIKTSDGDILVRSNGQAYSAQEFASIPVINNQDGKPVYLGDIAQIKDAFEETFLETLLDQRNAIMINVFRVGAQSALEISATTKNYIEEFSGQVPNNISLNYWRDSSEYLATRVNAVLSSAFWGGILVLLLLSLFLRPSVAFWVFLGIPISFMGAFLFMPLVNGSFNVLSLFAFILVIGIVVDDAIVTGENIYRKIRDGHDSLEAAITGTKEITVPVTFGILTTVVAFLPLNYLDGTPFEFVASQMPMVVIPVLLMSLVESKLILPAHMSHIKKRVSGDTMGRFSRIQQSIAHGLENFVNSRYRPFIEKAISNKAITITALLSISSIILVSTSTGHTRFSPFPRVESDTIRINLVMPETTSFSATKQHINDIVKHANTLQEKYRVNGQSVITKTLATVGGNGNTLKPQCGPCANCLTSVRPTQSGYKLSTISPRTACINWHDCWRTKPHR